MTSLPMVAAMTVRSLKYAGIGSRQTPHADLDLMCRLGKLLADNGWLLRTGGAEGADEAFVLGAQIDIIDDTGPGGDVEIFLPWPSFQDWEHRGTFPGLYKNPKDEAFDLAAVYHPRWGYLKQGAKKLHARNMHIMLGWDLDDPVDCVVCWTPEAKIAGGTGQALRVAEDMGIPVANLADADDRALIDDALRENNTDPFRGRLVQ